MILPDSIRNYLTKFADDRWMRQQGFFKADWEVGTVGDVVRALGRREVISLDLNDKRRAARPTCSRSTASRRCRCSINGKLAGILTESDLLHQLMTGRVDKNTVVRRGDGAQGLDGVDCTRGRASCRGSSSAARSRSSSTRTAR